jgi:hypothetical protein
MLDLVIGVAFFTDQLIGQSVVHVGNLSFLNVPAAIFIVLLKQLYDCITNIVISKCFGHPLFAIKILLIMQFIFNSPHLYELAIHCQWSICNSVCVIAVNFYLLLFVRDFICIGLGIKRDVFSQYDRKFLEFKT